MFECQSRDRCNDATRKEKIWQECIFVAYWYRIRDGVELFVCSSHSVVVQLAHNAVFLQLVQMIVEEFRELRALLKCPDMMPVNAVLHHERNEPVVVRKGKGRPEKENLFLGEHPLYGRVDIWSERVLPAVHFIIVVAVHVRSRLRGPQVHVVGGGMNGYQFVILLDDVMKALDRILWWSGCHLSSEVTCVICKDQPGGCASG
jgi:hypothetical protein